MAKQNGRTEFSEILFGQTLFAEPKMGEKINLSKNKLGLQCHTVTNKHAQNLDKYDIEVKNNLISKRTQILRGELCMTDCAW